MATKPIIMPLNRLLHSRKFIVLVLMLVSFYLIPQSPYLNDAWKDRVATAVFYGGGALLAAMSGEELIQAAKGKPASLDDLIRGIMEEVLAAAKPDTPTLTDPIPAPTGEPAFVRNLNENDPLAIRASPK